MDGTMASARTSLISSVDSCYTNDSTSFARFLAAAAETMSGASLSGEQRRNLFVINSSSLIWKTREIRWDDFDVL